MTRQPARPNILYIQSDQHSARVMGCAGDPVVRTPSLDVLAASGTVFDNAYCASPICVPSRMSMLTGRYPHENEVWTNSHALDPSVPTFAHALGAAGYRPAQVGRMHFVGPDQLHGFTERHIGDHSPNLPGGVPVDHGALEGTAGPHRISLQKSGHGQSAYEVHDEHVATAAVEYLERFAATRRGGESTGPFCLAVGLMLPHQPFVARKDDYKRYVGKVGMPRNPRPYAEESHPYLRWWRRHAGIEDVTPEEVLRARTAYWALVERTDALVGKILRALESTGLAENTLVIYTADHGEQVGERGLWWKQTFYDDSVKVPAIVSWPGVVPQGVHNGRVINQFDLNATMLAAAGAPPLPRSHGRSLLGVMADPETTDWEDVAFSEYCTEPGDAAHSDGDRIWQQRMVRRGDWKLIYYHGMPPQLFNLADDPDELRDLSDESSSRRALDELTARALDGWDPERIEGKIRAISRDQEILTEWARRTGPGDRHRWDLRPEWDYLDEEQMPAGGSA